MPNRYSEYLLTRGTASGGDALLAYQQEKKSSAVKNYFPLPDFIFFPISVTARSTIKEVLILDKENQVNTK